MNKLLRFTSVLMIIGGAFFIVAGVVAVLGVGALSIAIGNSGRLTTAALITLVSGIAQLIAGIVGLRSAEHPFGHGSCILWGIIVMALTVASAWVSHSGGRELNWLNLFVGLLIPALYLIGAFQRGDRTDSGGPAIDHR